MACFVSFLKYFCDYFMQNISTQSLFNMINGILDGSIETKNGDVSHVWGVIYSSATSI